MRHFANPLRTLHALCAAWEAQLRLSLRWSYQYRSLHSLLPRKQSRSKRNFNTNTQCAEWSHFAVYYLSQNYSHSKQITLGLPSFDIVIIEIHSCVSGAIIAMIWWNYFDVCVRLHFCEFYCVLLCILYCFFSFYYLYCLSVCLYVSCLCLWAMLPDLNKMMMMMITLKAPPGEGIYTLIAACPSPARLSTGFLTQTEFLFFRNCRI